MRVIYLFYFIFLLIFFQLESLYSQEEYLVNNSRFLQKSNPSYFGYNSLLKVGVLYNSLTLNAFERMNNKYIFGTISFDNQNFSLGVDVNSFAMEKSGYGQTIANLTYVYKLQLDNYLFFLPAITGGLATKQFNPDNLTFGDQLSIGTGQLLESNDPLASIISNVNYFDLGASFLLHSEDFMAGLTIKHINKPNDSFNKEDDTTEKPIQIGIQGAYEFDINPYERRYLPRYSYLMVYLNAIKVQNSIHMYLSQELQLGEFSVGLSQQAGSSGLNNLGVSFGLSAENFDFGASYNFNFFNNPGKVFSPSIFELYVTFDFSIYRRNQRGLFKRIQIDNYY